MTRIGPHSNCSARHNTLGLSTLQGVIQHATINNLAFGRNIEETLRILQALQYVQENPDEVRRIKGPLTAASVVGSPETQQTQQTLPQM